MIEPMSHPHAGQKESVRHRRPPPRPRLVVAIGAAVVTALGACAETEADLARSSSDAADEMGDGHAEGPPDGAAAPDAAPLDLSPGDGAPGEVFGEVDASTSLDAGSEDAVAPTPLAPPAVWLTVAEVPRAMNGSLASVVAPLSWRLRVNRAHVTLDAYAEAGSGPIRWSDARIGCDDGAGARDMGPLEVIEPGHARVLVDAFSAFADGAAVVCTLSAPRDGATADGGVAVATAAFAFDAAELAAELDPFPTRETWLVTFSRDLFRTVVTPRGDQTASVVSEPLAGGDGVPDLDEALFALGLATPANPAATAVVRAHLARRVATLTRSIYELDDPLAPPLAFAFEGEPEAEPLLALTSEALDARRVSRVAVGGDGDAEDQAAGTFGRAWIDWNNQTTQDNTSFGVGVFPTALARAALDQPIAALLLGACRPDLGGVPFGADPADASFLGVDGVPPEVPRASVERAELYDLLIRFASLGIASILAHEVGHSLGLVPPGPAPQGLFAEVAVDFVAAVTTAAHIDTPGLNIMQTGSAASVGEILGGEEPRFEPLSRAYLRRMLVVGPVID
jgi:hypothetical protein